MVLVIRSVQQPVLFVTLAISRVVLNLTGFFFLFSSCVVLVCLSLCLNVWWFLGSVLFVSKSSIVCTLPWASSHPICFMTELFRMESLLVSSPIFIFSKLFLMHFLCENVRGNKRIVIRRDKGLTRPQDLWANGWSGEESLNVCLSFRQCWSIKMIELHGWYFWRQ